MGDEEGNPPAPKRTRRFAKSAEGWSLAIRAREFAKSADEPGFAEMLHRFDVWEGDPEFENGMAIFREVLEDLRRRGR